jgi:hypothetical protein
MSWINLTAKKIYPPIPAPMAIPIDFVKPLSYEFRVAETIDDSGKITKVSLQVQIWEHDEYGSGVVHTSWTDVPRFKFDKNGTLLLS